MKKEKLNQIADIDSLATIIIELLEKIGLLSIKRISKSILFAVEEAPLGSKNVYFFLTLSELNGKVEPIKELVEEEQKKLFLKDKSTIEKACIISTNKKISNYFQDWIKKETNIQDFNFWAREDLIKLIDKNLPEHWKHNDPFLKKYEREFIEVINNEAGLKKFIQIDKKYETLLNVFIEPKIYIFEEDKETLKPIKTRIKIDQLLAHENFIISGEAGTGKSTLLKEISKRLIKKNETKVDKCIPIYIKDSDIFDNNFSLWGSIEKSLKKNFTTFDIDKIFDEYYLKLLVDSIDGFERKYQESILKELNQLTEYYNLNYIICTRNYEYLTRGCDLCEHSNPTIHNFDLRQVKLYLDQFFRFDIAKSNNLWETLLDNNTLEKIPVTPLVISIISILYEDKGYEIPATITDVYDNFNQFLLGRLNVATRLEFLKINIKERILSIYALEIIQSKNRQRKTAEEFIEFVQNFFKKKSITVSADVIPDLLKALTDGTGILYKDDNKYISFKHDHFMEYYASKEIFNHHRNELEDTLIDRFTQFNWQNTAVFYCGRTKDMPSFLEKLLIKVKSYKLLNDCLIGISGLGYVLQSLWMTDSVIRKNGVLETLNLLIKADSEVKRLSASKFHYFKNINDPDISIMLLAWFYKHFNSITLKDPLFLAFDKLVEQLAETDDTIFTKDKYTILYQLFCIAATLNTGRTGDESKLNQLKDKGILTIPFFALLIDSGIDILEAENKAKLRKDFKLESKIRKYISGIRFYLENPSEDIRFTSLEMINSLKMIELYTEGKTDAAIIKHAFAVLTKNDEPNWSISGCETSLKSQSGGATQLAKLLLNMSHKIQTDYDKKKTIIGIFDNDAKGCQEFNGLDNNTFLNIDNRCKKHKILNIYAIKLPIPPKDEFKSYHQPKQEFRLFEIEHYFPLDFLKENNMVKASPIPDTMEIKDKKGSFSKEILKMRVPGLFENFIYLFREIDNITKTENNYIEIE